MDATLQGVRDLYAVVGLGGGVLIVLVGLLLVIWRSGVRVKDDPLVGVIKEAQTANRELTTEFVQSGLRQNEQSKAHISVLTAQEKALTGITDELKEGRKVQTGLVDIVKAVNQNVVDARADINEMAVKQAARAADLHGEVLSTISDAQAVILAEFTRLMDAAIAEIKAALKPLMLRRGASPKFKQAVEGINNEIDKLRTEVRDYATAKTRPPDINQTVNVSADSVDVSPKSVLAGISTGRSYAPSSNGNYADGRRWLAGDDK